MKVLTYLEDKLIMWLTAICWWFDLHFNLKSKDLANPFMLLVTVLFFGPNIVNESGYVGLLAICFFVPLINLLFFRSIYEASKDSPNPNRNDTFFKVLTFSAQVTFIIFFQEVFMFKFSGMVMQFSWFYILCTEPMPPAEKEKRKNKKSLKNLELSSQL